MLRIATLMYCCALAASANTTVLSLSLKDAEDIAIKGSFGLKAQGAQIEALQAQSDAAYTLLFPQLGLRSTYTYLSALPKLSFGGGAPTEFGAHHNFSFGPTLSYTLWDNFSSLRHYEALNQLALAQKETLADQKSQLLEHTRMAYTAVLLKLEELRLIDETRALAHSEAADISKRQKAGSASELDGLLAERQVSAFEIQFEQKQAELASAIMDLYVLMGTDPNVAVDRPGPSAARGVSLTLDFDSLDAVLDAMQHMDLNVTTQLARIKSQELLAAASEKAADGLAAQNLPSLHLNASSQLLNPNGPIVETINQNTISITLSLPLFLGDPTPKLVAQKRAEANSARYLAQKLTLDAIHDRAVAGENLASLKRQADLAILDIAQAKKAQRLFYQAYVAGKITLTEVHKANVDTLKANMLLLGLKAQTIRQYASLATLSAQEPKE